MGSCSKMSALGECKNLTIKISVFKCTLHITFFGQPTSNKDYCIQVEIGRAVQEAVICQTRNVISVRRVRLDKNVFKEEAIRKSVGGYHVPVLVINCSIHDMIDYSSRKMLSRLRLRGEKRADW